MTHKAKNSVARLYALNVLGAHTRFTKGRANKQLCTATKRNGTPCRMLALSGLKVCGVHGGYSIKAQRGEYQPKRSRVAFQCDAPSDAPDRSALYALDIWRQPMSKRDRDALALAFDQRANDPALWRAMLRRQVAPGDRQVDGGATP